MTTALGLGMQKLLRKRLANSEQTEKLPKRSPVKLFDVGPLWAPTSDLLTGENLLKQEEIEEIQKALQTEVQVSQTRELPMGVYKSRNGRFQAQYRKKHIGEFETIAEAEQAYKNKKQAREDLERTEHYKQEITRDADGNATIQLTQGHVAIVDAVLWHYLTWRRTWQFNKGYAVGGSGPQMHQLVFQLLHPQYVPSKEFSIDHRNSKHTLDNRASNLRVATASEQIYNQTRKGGVSNYFGLSWQSERKLWSVHVKKGRVSFFGGHFLLEMDAARSYNTLAKEHYGDFAKVNVIPTDAISVGFDDQNKRIGLAAQRKRLQIIEEAQQQSVNPVSQA